MTDALTRHRDQRRASSMGLADSALQGVTVSFLAQVFRMDANKVKRKLVNCPIKETRQRGTTQTQHLYDLATAAQYLVEPEIDPQEFIQSLRKEDLPPSLSTAYWDAALKRQRWEENAGQLWRTDTIRGAIGSMFQSIKFQIQLWADAIERQTGLTEEQRDILNEMTDELQANIYEAIRENAQQAMTRPQIAELEDMLRRAEEGPSAPVILKTMEDDEFDDEARSLL